MFDGENNYVVVVVWQFPVADTKAGDKSSRNIWTLIILYSNYCFHVNVAQRETNPKRLVVAQIPELPANDRSNALILSGY